MLVDIFNKNIIITRDGITDENQMLYETLYPQLWTYAKKINKNNLLYNTVIYTHGNDINKYVISLFKYILNDYELRTQSYNDSYDYYYNNHFFVIDCNIFYGKMLLEFITNIIENRSIISKNIFIFTYFELIDRNTQNDIFSKGYRYIKTCNFIFVSNSNYNAQSMSRFNIYRISNPSTTQYKKYLQYFIKRHVNTPFFEPVIDKIILVGNNDIYQMLFMVEIFKYDPNVINRYVMEEDINNLAQIIGKKKNNSKVESDYYELRELLYNLLEKADFNTIIKVLVTKLFPLLEYDSVQRSKGISIITKHATLTGLANKHIYILECIICELLSI